MLQCVVAGVCDTHKMREQARKEERKRSIDE